MLNLCRSLGGAGAPEPSRGRSVINPDPLFGASPASPSLGDTVIPCSPLHPRRAQTESFGQETGSFVELGFLLNSAGSLLLEYLPLKSPRGFLSGQCAESPTNTIPDAGAASDPTRRLCSSIPSSWICVDAFGPLRIPPTASLLQPNFLPHGETSPLPGSCFLPGQRVFLT